MSPSFDRVTLCGRCPWGSLVRSPYSPQMDALGVSSVWVLCALLFWLSLNCCFMSVGWLYHHSDWL